MADERRRGDEAANDARGDQDDDDTGQKPADALCPNPNTIANKGFWALRRRERTARSRQDYEKCKYRR